MRDKVVLGITLAVVLLVTLVIYGAVDTGRLPATQNIEREESVESGKKIYAQYCIQCHGPLGEGCVGPALYKDVFRPEIDGAPNPDYDAGTGEDFIKKTVARGRPSNQPGVQMPAWSVEENGPLNEQQIDDVTNFILHGNWGEVLENAASASNMGEPLPAYPGFEDPDKLTEVKQVMLEKGCLNCHTMGKGGGAVAADLSQVGSRRTEEWLRTWIKDPKSVPATERGPNLWLIGPTPSLETPSASASPTATPVAFQMNDTYMPTIEMTDEELELLVEYLSHAKIATR